MRVLVQRSGNSKVEIDSKTVGEIQDGLVILVGFTMDDDKEKIDYLVKKIVNLRIFPDDLGIMNKSILDVSGSVLSVSQFTLYADCKKGNRPSYINAMNPTDATVLYDKFNEELKKYVPVETGVFGEDMKVTIENIGPTTIWLER